MRHQPQQMQRLNIMPASAGAQQHLGPAAQQQRALTHPHHRASQSLQRPVLKKATQQREQQETLPLLSLSSLHPDLQQLVRQRQQQPLQQAGTLLPHPLCELDPAALTWRIKQCSSWRDAAVLFAQQAPCLNPINLSALLVRLAHLPGPPSQRPANWQPFVRQVLATSQPLLQCAEARQLANMAWALAKLGLQDGSNECLFLPAATAQPGASTPSMVQQPPQEAISHAAPHTQQSSSSPGSSSSDGPTGCAIRSWVLVWQQQVMQHLHSASCRDVSNILWALATSTRASQPPAAAETQQQGSWRGPQQQQQPWHLQQHQHLPGYQQQWQQQPLPPQQPVGRWGHSRFVQELLSALHRTLPSSSPQDAANAVWALATLQVRPSAELASFLLVRLQSHFGALQPREVATTLWALSQLQAVPPSSWLQECLLRQVGRPQWQGTQPRHWVMCLTACAHLGQVPPTPWLTECLQALQTHMQQPAAVQPQPQPLPPQQLHEQHARRPDQDSSSSSESSSSAGASTGGCSLCPQDLSNTVWALATLRVKPNPQWMDGFVACSAASLAAAAPQELANTIWGLQVLRVTPSTAWLDAFDAASLRHMEGFTPQGLADILAAQARLGLQPSMAWREAWAAALKASWGAADASAVCKALWAAAKYQLPLGRAWLGQALQQAHEPLLLPALAAGTLSTEELLRLVWAVGRLCQGLLGQELSNLLGLYCCRAAGRMTGAQLARGAWGLARLVPLPREGLLGLFHDLAGSKLKYLPLQEGQVLEQKLALLRDAVAKSELLGTNWRVVLRQRRERDERQQKEGVGLREEGVAQREDAVRVAVAAALAAAQ